MAVTLAAAEPPEEARREEPPADGRPLVLVAEDDAELRAALVRTLGEAFRVEAVADGRAAFEAVRRLRPAVVVSDVMMPGLDGVGLVRALRSEPWGEAVPVVLVTALDAPARVVGAFAAGADDYVTKPFSRAVLLARVRRWVGGRSASVEPAGPVGPDGAPLSPADARLVERVRSAVEERLGDPDLDVPALGRAVGLSKAQLGRRLSAAQGVVAEEVRRAGAAGPRSGAAAGGRDAGEGGGVGGGVPRREVVQPGVQGAVRGVAVAVGGRIGVRGGAFGARA